MFGRVRRFACAMAAAAGLMASATASAGVTQITLDRTTDIGRSFRVDFAGAAGLLPNPKLDYGALTASAGVTLLAATATQFVLSFDFRNTADAGVYRTCPSHYQLYSRRRSHLMECLPKKRTTSKQCS